MPNFMEYSTEQKRTFNDDRLEELYGTLLRSQQVDNSTAFAVCIYVGNKDFLDRVRNGEYRYIWQAMKKVCDVIRASFPALSETNTIAKQLEADIRHVEETTPDLLVRQAAYTAQWRLSDDAEA